jgi:GNAT superfamily N-acetyltransferase
MDILTLELLDVTVFQALLELRGLLADHPGEAMRILGGDELLRVNVAGFLEKQGRTTRLIQQGAQWELQVAQAARPDPPAEAGTPAGAPAPPPVLLLRSAFAPGDRALGRRLLLEALSTLEPGLPWVCLAHQAVELLEDPGALAVLEGLRGRGIPVHVSAASLRHAGQAGTPFDQVPDEGWQRLLVRGGLTVL